METTVADFRQLNHNFYYLSKICSITQYYRVITHDYGVMYNAMIGHYNATFYGVFYKEF